MMQQLFRDLAWLPNPPEDFRQRCRDLARNGGETVAALRHLATHALDESQLIRLADAFQTYKKSGQSLAPLSSIKLGLVGNATLSTLVPALIATGLRHGLDLEVVKADYGQTVQEALSPDSAMNRAKPDMILLALDHHGLPQFAPNGDGGPGESRVEHALNFVNTMREGFRQNSGALCILQTVPPPLETLFGSADRYLDISPRWVCDEFNRRIAALARDGSDLLLDVASVAETVGLAWWHSPTEWNIAKFAFDSQFLPLYADHVCRLLAATRGKSRRCLILDLDNTVWGGVIGDDGMDGILIGQGDPTGEAHLEVQRIALSLRSRGIVLAVSSKNTDEVARRVFREHPEMLLREEHIAVFQANWNDKASNIKAIAETLELGLDAMVFLDDNPVERGLVRSILPQVAVPELPDDAAQYARVLLAAGYFESIAFSQEDAKRAEFYQDNARRIALKSQAGDVEGYLQSLNMQITFAPFDSVGRARIAQLINKSNQFNLTTRRYTEADIEQIEKDTSIFTLQVRLADTFGDNGMISVIICRDAGEKTWEIDTWLMSCRVLGRRVEQAVLSEIKRHACLRGIEKLVGVYLPTERNGMVRDHYAKLGFSLSAEEGDGESRWSIAVSDEETRLPMQVVRFGFDAADGEHKPPLHAR